MPVPDQPINVFDGNAQSVRDPVTGVVTYHGDFVQFFRKASDPLPRSLAEVKALLRKQVKDPALVALIDKARPDKDEQAALVAAVRECAAHAKGATWKASAQVREIKGGSVVVEQPPVVLVDQKPVDVAPATEVKPTSEESPK